jgi:hypothetical protein
MGKKTIISASVILLSIVVIGLSFAAQKGNNRKGKYLFRKNCRSCHVENGSAKELSPISETQAEWQVAFARDTFKHLSCSVEWEKRTEKDLLDIYTYMYDHAYDSPSPLKCK